MTAPALFWEIVRCPNLVGAMLGSGDCAKVVRAQAETGRVPAPWVGRLETAPILFISPDPGFDRRELSPTAEWNDRAIEEFYFRRRDGSPPPRVAPPSVLRPDDARVRAVTFWSEVRACAAELLDRPRSEVQPGVDFALTEVVHCRSSSDEGRAAAAPQCARRYLERILAASAARVVIGFGDEVRAQLHRVMGTPSPAPSEWPALAGPLDVKGRTRVFAFLPEPDSTSSRTPSRFLSPQGLATLRRFLTGEDVGDPRWGKLLRKSRGQAAPARTG